MNGFDWNQARAFLATARHGSFSAAARALGLTQPTLSRQVAAFEAALGVMLFERVGKSLHLTDSGREMQRHLAGMADAADQAALVASGQSQSIEGMIQITASDIMAAHVLPPALAHLRRVAPKLRIDVIADNAIRDIMRREADIAVRHVRPEQPDLVARLVSESQAFFYASRDYVAKRGLPQNKQDLSRHDFISFGDPSQVIDYMKPLGIHLTTDNFPVGSESGLVAWELAQRGFGLLAMSTDVGDSTDGMVRVLPDMEPIEFPVWLVTHRELHTSRRIRLVFDALAEFLAAQPGKLPLRT